MLIEKIEGVDLSYKLFETILDAVKIGCITIDQVEQYCYKVEGINAYYTEDHINILSELNILSSGVKIQLKKQSVINNKIKFLQIFLDKLKEDYSIYKFIDVDTIEYDNGKLYALNSEISYKYSNLRNFFIELNVMMPVKGNDVLLQINKLYNEYFKSRRRMTIEELEKILEKEREQGELAEKFVFEYEKKRLKCLDNRIKRISKEDTNAGYDIVSYESIERAEKIYIEVKSYSQDKIYLTANEMEKAREKRKSYYLYIVDVKRIAEENYEPQRINDPYKEILINDAIKKETESISVRIDQISKL